MPDCIPQWYDSPPLILKHLDIIALFPLLAVLGLAFLGLLGYHEAYVAQHPLIPTRLLKRRTVMAGCFLGAFHFFCQFAYESYFPSFLQVARSFSARDASYISESYVFSASIAALLCGVLVKWTHSYKIWMVVGVLLHIVGAIMMVRFRSLDTTTAEIVLSQVGHFVVTSRNMSS